MSIRVSSYTHRGHVRPRNEDRLMVDEAFGLFAVADGLGGHTGGEFAADYITKFLALLRGETAGRVEHQQVDFELGWWLAQASAAISRDRLKRGMPEAATTVVAAKVEDGGRDVSVAHVGDSRAYLITASAMRQLTVDHVHPEGGILRVIGDDPVEVDEVRISMKRGHKLLLCTDGLTNYVSEDRIRSVLAAGGNAENLVYEALDQGGGDNATVVLLERV